MDLLLLVLTGKLLKCTATHLRLVIGAAVGATLAAGSLLLLDIPYLLWLLLAYGVTGIVMVRLCFRLQELLQNLMALTCLFGGTLMLGGVYSFVSVQIPYFHKNGFLFVQIIGIGSFFCYLVTRIMSKWRKTARNHIYSVTLYFEGETRTVPALWDTGNGLKEPISGTLVSVLEEACVTEWLPRLQHSGMRVIPYHTLGTSKGYLEGYRLEKISFTRQDIAGKEIVIEAPMIGLYRGTLSSSGTYKMILPAELVP